MNEQALKERLKKIAKDQNRSFQEVWKSLLLERFLARLSCSQYHRSFIFKGGLLLSYYLRIARETIDIDLLARHLNSEVKHIEAMFISLCALEVNDGFLFAFGGIKELDHNHMSYPGFRAKLDVKFGEMKDRIQIDIGVGDKVEPAQISWEPILYRNKPLFEGAISLSSYPVETIFTEKLETVISRGVLNSRMKDYHDILLLCRNFSIFDLDHLKSSVLSTFENRGTNLEIPIVFSGDDYESLQSLWVFHLRSLDQSDVNFLKLPEKISELIEEVNSCEIWRAILS